MIYSQDCEILTTNTIINIARHTLKVTKGLIYKVEVEFPPGCAGLIHLVIYDGGHQVWPSNPDQTFHSDGYTISFEDTFLKFIAPYQFDIFGYTEGTDHDHTPVVRLGLVSKEVFIARFLPTYTYKYFLEMLDKLAADQEAARKAIIEKPFSWIK